MNTTAAMVVAMVLSVTVHAQVPPMPRSVVAPQHPVLHPCTNCPPPMVFVKDGMMELGWTPQPSTWDIVEQILFRSTVIPYRWVAYRFFDDGISSNCYVPCTNGDGFFWVSSIDKNGFMWSPPP